MTKDLKVATWNVRGITHKEDELDKEIKSSKIDIAFISETKK
jgi:exonuclease III